jgi:hypothetical protein
MFGKSKWRVQDAPMDRGWIDLQHSHSTIHRCFQASENRLSTITQSVSTRFQCSIWQNDQLFKPQSAVNRLTCSISIQLFTGTPKRLKTDFRWQLSQIVNIVRDHHPLHLDQTKASALGDLEIMPIADLRFSQWLSTNKMCGVCVSSVVILTPLGARAEAVFSTFSAPSKKSKSCFLPDLFSHFSFLADHFSMRWSAIAVIQFVCPCVCVRVVGGNTDPSQCSREAVINLPSQICIV